MTTGREVIPLKAEEQGQTRSGAGRHDDQVDAIGIVGQLLDAMVRPAPPKRRLRDQSGIGRRSGRR